MKSPPRTGPLAANAALGYNKRWGGFWVKALSIFSVLLLAGIMARAEKESGVTKIKVRMVELPSNLDLRLLLERVRNISGEKFSISGFHLRDSRGRMIPGEKLDCRFEKQLPNLLNLNAPNSASSEAWICRGSNAYELVLENGVRIYPEGGFTEFRKKSYRGGIEFQLSAKYLQVINLVNIERYLVGLLTKEMSPDFPKEALKAQAVAARSYAIARAADQRRDEKAWDLLVTPNDQVYHGAHAEDPRTLAAVKETAHEALFFKTEVVMAYYHASSGGHLEIPENAWGSGQFPADRLAYGHQENPWDAKLLPWELTIAPALGDMWADVGALKEIKILSRTNGNRVERLQLKGRHGSVTLSGADIRRRFGPNLLKSLNFELYPMGEQGWKIIGRGWGHGVGLSQWGAKAMAEAGMDYKKILKFHYPYAELKSWLPSKLQKIEPQAIQVPQALTR